MYAWESAASRQAAVRLQLDGPLGEYPDQITVLYERRSPGLGFEDAFTEAVDQVAAPGGLDRRVDGPGLSLR